MLYRHMRFGMLHSEPRPRQPLTSRLAIRNIKADVVAMQFCASPRLIVGSEAKPADPQAMRVDGMTDMRSRDYTTMAPSCNHTPHSKHIAKAHVAVCGRRLRSGLPAAARHWRWPPDLLKHTGSHLDQNAVGGGLLPLACARDTCQMHLVVARPGRHARVANRYHLPSAWAGHAATAINTKHASSAFVVIAAMW
jgi:hypothetical protein